VNRREAITLLSGATIAWPLATRAQQSAMPVIGYIGVSQPDAVRWAAFRQGLNEHAFIEGHNVAIEYRWAEGRNDRLPALAADLVRRQVNVIATPGNTAASLAAKSATSAIPIVFGVAEDPVKLGLVASLGKPGGNATGVNFFLAELVAKRLGLLRQLLPGSTRIAVLVNPTNPTATTILAELESATGVFQQNTLVLNASTSREIDAAFESLVSEHAEALFVAPDPFFNSRRVQLATFTARHALPAIFAAREYVEAGGLMSYGTDLADMFHQVGVYTGNIIKGARPADLPVLQSTKFDFAINLPTARALGIEVPPSLLSIADEVIE
jgi:putative tryptophan/tyrosine transport system substrate-binding protein